MFAQFMSWVHSNAGLKLVSAAVVVAASVKAYVPPYTIAAKVADHIIEIGVVLGVSSSTARAPAVP